jgi:hypothetical protein
LQFVLACTVVPSFRFYALQVVLYDISTKAPGPQSTPVTFFITITDLNDPPELISPNVTVVDENSLYTDVVYTFQAYDEDGHSVTFTIDPSPLNNLNTAEVPVAYAFSLDFFTGNMYPASPLNFELGVVANRTVSTE